MSASPEVHDYRRDPIIHPRELQLGHVYTLVSERYAASFNYAGTVELDSSFGKMVIHRFHGPRVDVWVGLAEQPDGTLQDGERHTIELRRYTEGM